MVLASYLYQTESTIKMGNFGIGLYAVILALGIYSLIHLLLDRPLAKFRKVRSARVEIIQLGYARTSGSFHRVTRTLKEGESIGVKFLDRKWLHHKMFLIRSDGMSIGDRGILKYQGKYGREFIKEDSVKDENDTRYYHFAKREK